MPDTTTILESDVRVVPLDAPLGARIEGFDRKAPCDAATKAKINQALLDHHLLVFPGKPMTTEETRDFGALFGDLRQQLLRYKRSEVPEVSVMESTLKGADTDKTAVRAEDWHTDDSYFEVPAKATILHSIELPDHGGATWFCNMHAVYDALPVSLKERIDGLRAMHGYDTPRARNRPSTRTAEEMAETPDVEQPLVRTHPETGRKGVYLNFNRLDRIVGMERDESDALLDELGEYARQPQFHHGHVWQRGDAVLWDNRCTMHRVDIDYPVGQRRIMHRVLINGDRPF